MPSYNHHIKINVNRICGFVSRNTGCCVLIFLIQLCTGTVVFAQSDSVVQTTYFSGLLENKSAVDNIWDRTDTLLLRTLFFDPVRETNPYLVVTGNPGAAHFDIIRNAGRSSALTDGFSQFDGYLLSSFRSLPGRSIPSRFTLIDYHLASKREQHIMLNHEQHLKKWWFAGIDFGAMSSPGDFSRQLNTNRNFRIWNAYESPRGTYRSYLSFTTNRVNNQENGGITSDSVFENASSLDTRTLPVYLRNAESTLKTRSLFVKQELSMGKLFAAADTVSRKKTFGSGDLVLSHTAVYNRRFFLFESADPDSGYFNNFFLDSISTMDSVFFGQFTNELLLTYHSDSGSFNYYIGGGVLIESDHYHATGISDDFNRNRGIIRAGWRTDRIHSSLKGSFHSGGDFGETWDVAADISISLNQDKINLILGGSAGRYPQSLKDQLYHSNHFRWNHDFNPVEQSSLEAGVFLPAWRTHFKVTGFIEKYRVFYREDFIPQTYDKPVSFGKVALINQLKAGRFTLDNRIDGFWSGNENVVRMPAAAVYSALYYNDIFFKKALGFRAGIDFNFHSSYYTYGYMPATGIFYLQDEKKTGDYPLCGVFVNLKIKTASLFIRVDHLNAGMGSRTYYGAYGYPLQGRTLKFGVNWALTD